ncbi:MAG: hypothetical protein AAF685_05860 [Cyanobacteria bacterium P01_C01_bin.89]
MKISAPELAHAEGNIKYRVAVESATGSQPLWFSLAEQYTELVSDRADGALAALLFPAMVRGEDIHVEGVLSERLYYNLSGRCQALLRSLDPTLKTIKIHAPHLASATSESTAKATGVATGFSGGVDSFCALVDHYPRYNPTVVPSHAITHLLYNNVGSHGSGGKELFLNRYRALQPFVKTLGLPFIAVNSNAGEFYNGLPFAKVHTVLNTAVSLVLQRGIRVFLYASALHYAKISSSGAGGTAKIDPLLLPLLSTENLDAVSVGCEYTRAEKLLRLTEVPDTYAHLDVCCASHKQGGNCSQCDKCLWTLVALEAVGALEHYENQFNMERYRQIRDRYLPEILLGDHPRSGELLTLAASHNYTFPKKARLFARIPLFLKGRQTFRHWRDRLRKQ